MLNEILKEGVVRHGENIWKPRNLRKPPRNNPKKLENHEIADAILQNPVFITGSGRRVTRLQGRNISPEKENPVGHSGTHGEK